MNRFYITFIAILLFISSPMATPSAPGSEVFFITPKDGESVKGPVVHVRFGIKNMEVVPAGTKKEHTGHHHLFVDAEPAKPGKFPIAKDAKHIHFGGGETETKLTLSPGKHTLQLVLGDHNHIPHEPAVMSKRITITVE